MNSKKQGQILPWIDIEPPQMLCSSHPPTPQALSLPHPFPLNKVKITLGQKVARSLPSPYCTAALPHPTSALPPAGTGAGGGGNLRHRPRSKHTWCQNINITIDIRTIRVKWEEPLTNLKTRSSSYSGLGLSIKGQPTEQKFRCTVLF